MNQREPTVAEAHYMYLCRFYIGCLACILDGLTPERQNPNESHIIFHHDPDFGSVKPNCHFHGYGLCVYHHKCENGHQPIPEKPVRHINEARFNEVYAPDAHMNYMCWKLLSVMDEKHLTHSGNKNLMAHCPHPLLKGFAA